MENITKRNNSELGKIQMSTTTQPRFFFFFQRQSNVTLHSTNLQGCILNKDQKKRFRCIHQNLQKLKEINLSKVKIC